MLNARLLAAMLLCPLFPSIAFAGQTEGDPCLARFLAQLVTGGDTRRLAFAGELVLVADSDAGLVVIDVSNPGIPTIIGTVDTPGEAIDVVVSGTLAYVADRLAGVQIVDFSIPTAPTIVGSSDAAFDARSVAIDASTLYVADGTSLLPILDVSDPTEPQVLGTYDAPGGTAIQAVVAMGDRVLVGRTFGDLIVLDVSDPGNPQVVGETDLPGRIEDVAASGTFAYVATGFGGLAVVDLADPSAPTLLAETDPGNYSNGVSVSGSQVLLADDFGSYAIDVSDPDAPEVLGRIGGGNEVAIAVGPLIYQAAGPGGLIVSSRLACQPGACCIDGGCIDDLVEEDCTLLGGVFQGIGRTCGSSDCSSTAQGACCMADGTCVDATEAMCDTFRGDYQGDDFSCADVACGACINDVDGDGMVTTSDLIVLLETWGECPESVIPVPCVCADLQPLSVGAVVYAAVDNPQGNPLILEGDPGVVYCGRFFGSVGLVLCSWDITTGHEGLGLCDCPGAAPGIPEASGFYVFCSEVTLTPSGDPLPSPPGRDAGANDRD